jgi:NTP pyrophosphatase (non-canonical NTP hydrolase)
MTFDEYQKAAYSTNIELNDKFKDLIHHTLGLGDEAGEVQAIVKKWLRDQGSDFDKLDLQNLKKELGDVLWHVAVLAEDLGLSLSEISDANVAKLADRKKRGVLGGSGDNR